MPHIDCHGLHAVPSRSAAENMADRSCRWWDEGEALHSPLSQGQGLRIIL